MPALALIAVIGLAGGILSGLFGIGGGLVIVPGLIILSGFAAAKAAGTSLAALLLPVGLFGPSSTTAPGRSTCRQRRSSRSASCSAPTSGPGSGCRSTRGGAARVRGLPPVLVCA